MININSYDIDGVLFLGANYEGLRPGPEDVIVTGRSFEQREETLRFIRGRGIPNMIFFNTLSRADVEYGRIASGRHKASTFERLYNMGIRVVLHFEDDHVQANEIEQHFRTAGIGPKVILLDTYEKLGVFKL